MWFTRQDRRARLGDLKARRDVARTCAYRFSRVRVETRSFRQRLDVEFLHATNSTPIVLPEESRSTVTTISSEVTTTVLATFS